MLTSRRADAAADTSINKALDATQAAVDDALAGRSRALLQVTAGLAQVPDYVARINEALRTGNRSDLLDQADEFREQTGAAWALIADAAGILHAWTYERQLFDDDLSESALVGYPMGGDSTEGVWIEPTPNGDAIFQAVAVPIFDPGRTTLFGVLVTALPVDSAFAEELRRHTNSEVVFFTLDSLGAPQVAVSTLPRGALDSAITALNPDSAFGGGNHTRVRMDVGEETWAGVVGPLMTASDLPVGGYVGFRSRNVELAAFTALQRTITMVFGGGLVLAVVASGLVARQISRPLQRLVRATRDVSEGRYSDTIDVRSADEIGELAAAFRHMVQELKAKEELVDYLSSWEGSFERLDSVLAEQRTAPLRADQPTLPDAPRAAAVPAARAARLELGSVLSGRYEVRDILGMGGMGVVYRAYDRQLDETVAIKTLRPDLAHTDAAMLERFKQEIRLARRITHRNVVRTHDLGEVDGMYYITMEYVEGTTLKTLITRRGPLPTPVTVTIGKQLCRALEVAHEQGIVHRDIKPQNLVVDARGFLKVMDFGIARLADRNKDALTQTGAAIGTVDYMPPEQLLGGEVDGRADLYSTGAVLFECVTGRCVFVAPTLMSVMAKHLEERPQDPREVNPDVHPALAALILKALEKHPDARWQSANEMHEALDKIEN